ncbi:hypothetical protein [Streptomyces sp. NPDC051214]|uniref:hypothetical protein n=1 Tax=Streptomyces sp. NPDC051214 TaxID=3155282 RepID=UPI003424E1B5
MTDHRKADGQQADHRVQQTLEQALEQALAGLLDVEAGLSEILLPSRQERAVEALHAALDAESGLAAILPPTQAASMPPADPADAEEALGDLTPAQLLDLRSHRDVQAASQALDHALSLEASPEVDRAVFFDLALDLARAIVRDLSVGRGTDNAVLVRARAIVHDLDRVRVLDRERGFDRDRAIDRARARARILDRARTRAVAISHAPDLDLATVRARARAGDLARVLALVLARSHGLAHIVIDIRMAEVRRAVGLALHRQAPALTGAAIASLNDFTAADLSNTDLTGIDLSGIRWSERGTQWPPSTDIDALKARSDQTQPGNGVWIIRSGTTTIHGLAEI